MFLNQPNLNQESKLKNKKSSKNFAKLSLIETKLYQFCWCFIVLFGFYVAVDLSKKQDVLFFGLMKEYFKFKPVYSFLGKKYYEEADYEWDSVVYWAKLSLFIPTVLYYFVMRITEVYLCQHRFVVSSFFTIIWTFYLLGPSFSIIIVDMLALFVIAVIFRRTFIVWTVYITFIFTGKYFFTSSLFEYLFPTYELQSFYFVLFGMGTLRTVSYCLILCQKKDSQINLKNIIINLVDLFEYQFYFPLYYSGPIFTYSQFKQQKKLVNQPWSLKKLGSHILQSTRYLIWFFIITVYLHYLYFFSIHHNAALIKSLPLFTLISLALAHNLHFCNKYVFLYGFPAQTASFDGIFVEGKPHCVVGKHEFTKMWRYFDKGLHRWLVEHIYLPLGGSIKKPKTLYNITRELINVAIPFVFVYLWHGMVYDHVWWLVTNVFGILVEKWAKQLYWSEMIQSFEKRFMTIEWSRRIIAIFASFTFISLIVSNLYFVIGEKSTNLYILKLQKSDLSEILLVFWFVYSGVQTSIEFERIAVENKTKEQ